MKSAFEYFKKNKFVVMQDALSKKDCDSLINYMFDLHKEGKLTKDEQCPLSDSIYGDIVFDELLQNLAEPIGNTIGKKLSPTYSYARIYRRGEVLKPHVDRKSCEISATLTLGFDAKMVWPIFFDEEKELLINLEPGELIVYKGCELTHWRPKFKGNWQVQVFLHYVDAEGKNKNFYKDKREDFGINSLNYNKNLITEEYNKKLTNEKNNVAFFNSVLIPSNDDYLPGYFCIDKNNLPELTFTKEECKKIVKISEENYSTSAFVGSNGEQKNINNKIRSAKIYDIENNSKNKWIYEKVSSIVNHVNNNYFDYDISGIMHNIQLVEYRDDTNVKGHYDWHIDVGNGNLCTRKISLSVQLSDPSDYKGGELEINNNSDIVVAGKEQGSVHLFPSYMLHRVTPIKKGIRHSLVIWIHGSKRFR